MNSSKKSLYKLMSANFEVNKESNANTHNESTAIVDKSVTKKKIGLFTASFYTSQRD